MAKIYAVKAGRKTGIFHSWDECSESVKGYSGASYKSFTSMEEAQAFLGLETSKPNATKTESSLPFNVVKAYVDGSYNKVKREYGSGVVILVGGKEERISKKGTDPTLVDMQNVAGEIIGSGIAMKWALDNGIEHLVIYHDYEGVAKWCTGEWKANKEGTKKYQNFYNDKIKGKVKVEFVKVKAHTGDHYNEVADKLAKAAIGIK